MAEGATSPAEAFIEAVTAQAREMAELPYVLSYAPVAQMNPFQRLLYSRAAENGFAIVPALVGTAAALLSRRSAVRPLAVLPLVAVLPLAAVVGMEGHHLARTYLNLVLPLTMMAGYGLALLWTSPHRSLRAVTVGCAEGL